VISNQVSWRLLAENGARREVLCARFEQSLNARALIALRLLPVGVLSTPGSIAAGMAQADSKS
jgi:hypothetical protein